MCTFLRSGCFTESYLIPIPRSGKRKESNSNKKNSQNSVWCEMVAQGGGRGGGDDSRVPPFKAWANKSSLIIRNESSYIYVPTVYILCIHIYIYYRVYIWK